MKHICVHWMSSHKSCCSSFWMKYCFFHSMPCHLTICVPHKHKGLGNANITNKAPETTTYSVIIKLIHHHFFWFSLLFNTKKMDSQRCNHRDRVKTVYPPPHCPLHVSEHDDTAKLCTNIHTELFVSSANIALGPIKTASMWGKKHHGVI